MARSWTLLGRSNLQAWYSLGVPIDRRLLSKSVSIVKRVGYSVPSSCPTFVIVRWNFLLLGLLKLTSIPSRHRYDAVKKWRKGGVAQLVYMVMVRKKRKRRKGKDGREVTFTRVSNYHSPKHHRSCRRVVIVSRIKRNDKPNQLEAEAKIQLEGRVRPKKMEAQKGGSCTEQRQGWLPSRRLLQWEHCSWELQGPWRGDGVAEVGILNMQCDGALWRVSKRLDQELEVKH